MSGSSTNCKSRSIRLSLAVLRLQEFGVRNELQIGRFWRDSLRGVRRRPRPDVGAGTFTQTGVAENLLDHFRLARSMKLTIICPPQHGHSSGSASYPLDKQRPRGVIIAWAWEALKSVVPRTRREFSGRS